MPSSEPPGAQAVFSRSTEADRDFQTFFELSGNGNVIADVRTGRFLRVNLPFCQLTGYTAEELLRMSPNDLTHPDDLNRDARGWHECLEQNQPHFEIEKRYLRKDGTLVWVSVTSTLVHAADGTALHAIGVVRDVTDRREAMAQLELAQRELETRVRERTLELASANEALSQENYERAVTSRQLAEANNKLATLFNACPLAILTLDCQYHVTSWNRSAERLLGWAEDELLGKMLPNAPTSPEVIQRFFQAARQNQPTQFDIPWPARDGRILDLAAWYAPLYETPGQLSGHVALLMDISEKRFLEKALLEESEREQRRIGQDLHDHLAQHLLGATFAAKALEGDLRRENSPSAERLDDLARLLNEAVRQVRDISRGLHPVELDSAGLMSSLEELAIKVNHSFKCRFVCEQPVLIHDPKTALHAYRIAQEAATIALQEKFGPPLTLTLTRKADLVTLDIRRPGRSTRKPLTLDEASTKIMEYRAKAIGGHFSIQNSIGKDFRITCTFPNPSP